MDLSRTAEYGSERRLDGGGYHEGTGGRGGGASPVLLMAQMGRKREEDEDRPEDEPRTGPNLPGALLYNKVRIGLLQFGRFLYLHLPQILLTNLVKISANTFNYF